MSATDLAAIVAFLVAAVLGVCVPTAIVSHHSTERARMCVEAGGAYLSVANTAKMECVR